MPDGISITWYGHATWGLEGPDGARVLLDPWFSGPTVAGRSEGQRDGRRDRESPTDTATHTGDNRRGRGAPLRVPVIAPVEGSRAALSGHGVENVTRLRQGRGARWSRAAISFLQTVAVHSGSIQIGGAEAGYLRAVGFPDHVPERHARVRRGATPRFHSDMALLKELYAPTIAIPADRRALHDGSLPGRPMRCRLLGVSHVVPGHYGTFPVLVRGLPAELQLRAGLARASPGR